jgi:hypothetical protein
MTVQSSFGIFTKPFRVGIDPVICAKVHSDGGMSHTILCGDELIVMAIYHGVGIIMLHDVVLDC